MVVAGPRVVGKFPCGAYGGGCRVLAAAHGCISKMVRLDARGPQVSCGPLTHSIIHVAYHSHLCYPRAPGGLISSWLL